MMKLKILFICNKPMNGRDANTIVDHIEAFEHYSSHKIFLYSNLGDISTKLDLNRFDVVIIHYSISIIYDHFLSMKAKQLLREFKGLKVIFIQDEYRQINKMISQLKLLNVDLIFTCFPEMEMERIYNKTDLPHVSLYSNLTGYIPERLLDINKIPPIKNRPLHIGYRGRKLSAWYGELSYEKWNIVEKWKEHVKNKAIKENISYHEKDRIYGNHWQDFILSCKATLGVESGTSVMDFTGELEETILLHELTHPNDDFYKIQGIFLKEHEGRYKLNQISPRCFEAIALKTVLVLYEGEYSHILVPDRHYIVLKKDFSNIDTVIAKLLDDQFLQNMADLSYQEIALNPAYSYKNFILRVDSIIEHEFKCRHKSIVKGGYSKLAFKNAISYIPLKKRLFLLCLSIYYRLPKSIQFIIRTVLRPQMVLKKCYFNFYTSLHQLSIYLLPVNSRRRECVKSIIGYTKKMKEGYSKLSFNNAINIWKSLKPGVLLKKCYFNLYVRLYKLSIYPLPVNSRRRECVKSIIGYTKKVYKKLGVRA